MTEARTLEEAFREICAREGPLRGRLEDFSTAVRAFSLPFAEAYDELVQRLAAGQAGTAAPGVGDPMPPFVLPDAGGALVSLEDILASGPAIVSFNRGHWCEYCAIELTALNQALNEFAAHGAQVVSIMPETREYIAATSNRYKSAFAILADLDNSYALSLGLAIWLGERVRKIYLEHGLNLDRFQRSDAWFVPIPATFVVGRDGRIAGRYVDPDFRRRMEIDDILAALKQTRRA